MHDECTAGVIVKETPSMVIVPPIFIPSTGRPLDFRYFAISDIAMVFFARATVSPR
jgi:hypothetical protein